MYWFATEPVFYSSVREGAFHSLQVRGGCTIGCLFPGFWVYGIHMSLSWSHRRRRFLEWIYVFAGNDLVVDLLAKGRHHVSEGSHVPVQNFRFLTSWEVAQGFVSCSEWPKAAL